MKCEAAENSLIILKDKAFNVEKGIFTRNVLQRMTEKKYYRSLSRLL